jgi:hypothetical protein
MDIRNNTAKVVQDLDIAVSDEAHAAYLNS